MSNFKTITETIEKKASEHIKEERGDYIGDDGLLVCGKCDTRKQGRYEMPWGVVTPPCMCKCEKERKEMEKQKEEQAMRIFFYREECFGRDKFKRMREWTFDKDDGANDKLSRVARNYADNFGRMSADGKGLLLYGSVGTGKTFLAACIANAVIDTCTPAMMTNFPTIRAELQESFEGRKKYIETLVNYPLLVLDDLSTESKSDYMNEIVYDVVDKRYRNGLPLIVTTNLTADEMKNASEINSKRVFSRLFEMCIPIHVEGADRRRERLKEAHAEYKDLLGY